MKHAVFGLGLALICAVVVLSLIWPDLNARPNRVRPTREELNSDPERVDLMADMRQRRPSWWPRFLNHDKAEDANWDGLKWLALMALAGFLAFFLAYCKSQRLNLG